MPHPRQRTSKWSPTVPVLDESLTPVFEEVVRRNPGEAEFHQAVREVLESLGPVVAKHPERNIAIIYGGAVHFSKDFIENDRGERVFGKVGAWTENGWTLSPDGPELIAISQEHGQVRTTPEALARMQIGDLLPIAPVHSCLTQDLLRGNTVII